MNDAPKKIRVYKFSDQYENPVQDCEPEERAENYDAYARTDTIPDPLDDPRVKALVRALEGILTHYVDIANSGDAGFWDCEEEPVVIAARTALSAITKEPKE